MEKRLPSVISAIDGETSEREGGELGQGRERRLVQQTFNHLTLEGSYVDH